MDLYDDDPTACVMFVIIYSSVWLSYYYAKSHSYATITVFAFIITISVYQYSFVTDYLFIVHFFVYLITIHFITQCSAFICQVIWAWAIVYGVHIDCVRLFFMLF